MTCREFIAFLMGYLDGELAAAEAESFEAHLATCRHCDAYLDSYRATVELGQRVCRDLEGEVPEDVPEDLVQAILEAQRSA